jgi:hypothetical protein
MALDILWNVDIIVIESLPAVEPYQLQAIDSPGLLYVNPGRFLLNPGGMHE